MAGDLIPPPSPAGKPDPDAGRRQELREAPQHEQPDELLLEVRPDGPGENDPAPAVEASRYRSRFGFITGALVGIALAACAVAAVVLTSRDRGGNEITWSAWKPTSNDRLIAAAEIAQHVGRQYRLNDGSQIVDVQAGPLAINDVPLTPVVRTAARGGDIIPIYGDGILYVLNGLGQDGSISREEPSAKRLALVEREALELALYTFRYVDDVDHVVAMLPPSPPPKDGEAAAAAATEEKPVPTLLFRPGDLRAELERPLALTFPAETPRPATMSDEEADVLTKFTEDNIFNASVVPSQTGQGFLVLEPPDVPSETEELLQSTIPGDGE